MNYDSAFGARARKRDGWSAALYVASGFLLGAAAVLLAVREAQEEPRSSAELEKEPSLVSRILRRIPVRIKIATGVGAARGAIRETGRMAKSRIKERRPLRRHG